MVMVRKRWPRPGTSEVIDQSIDIGPGGVWTSRISNSGAVRIGDMVPPSKDGLSGLSNWGSRHSVEPSALTVVRPPRVPR